MEEIMLVYGDREYRIAARVFLDRFRERVKRTRANNLDELRALLIQAGQLEQGMADAGHDATALTDSAAQAFYNALKGRTPELSILTGIQEGPDVTLTIKVPEGYEFYGLYPEQYVIAAEEMARERPGQRPLVVGIRSIGTSLSAAVSAALKGSRRCTVRPEGPPFEDKVSLPTLKLSDFDYAVIVDEGPGLSGSSVAAVWQALRKSGVKDITVILGHADGPGAAANETTRALWHQMNQWFIRTEPLPGRDLSAGRWRELMQGDWPPAFIPFERAKYLSDDLLWKFAGLGAVYENGRTAIENAWDRMHTLAVEGFGPEPLDRCRGFIAMPWIRGSRLAKTDARDPAVLDLLSQYVVRFAGPPLDPEEIRAGQDRLVNMAVANTHEALGEKWAGIARRKLDRGRDLHMFQSYGDGRLAPVEWVRNPDGRILKVNSFGHDADHTLVRKQSIAWDFAGLILEWDLSSEQTAEWLRGLLQQGACLAPEVLQFYEIAYAAFRMGLCNFCASQSGDRGEKHRLLAAEKTYCHKLLQVLNEERLAKLSAAVWRTGRGVPAEPSR